jgi:hypothetical protein
VVVEREVGLPGGVVVDADVVLGTDAEIDDGDACIVDDSGGCWSI